MTLNQKSLRQWHACMNMNYVTSNQYRAFDDLILEKKLYEILFIPGFLHKKWQTMLLLAVCFFNN